MKKILLSVSALSAAIIAFQLALMQILSIVQWHHFAYMVISVAMLGFGAAGTVLAILRKQLVLHADTLLPVFMMGSGIMMSVVTGLSQLPAIRFDSYLLFAEFTQGGNLLLSYLLFFLPFFLGALSLGLIFVRYVDRIGKIYFADLLGSGAGGLLMLVLITRFFPQQLPAIISLLPALAGMLLIPKNKFFFHVAFALFSLTVIGWKILQPPLLVLSQYKDLSKTLLLPGARINIEKTSPYGLVQSVSSPVLRYAPGLSLAAQKAADIHSAVFINGDWFGAVIEPDTSMVLDYTTFALPYVMAHREHVLVLKAGTCIDAVYARSKDPQKITIVEPNASILSALKKELATPTDSLLYDPGVIVYNLEPRTFLMIDSSKYDLVILPMVGTFGGSAGLYALQEQFTLTKESFHEMFNRLNAGGVICVTAWMDYPVRNPLKILSTMTEVLAEAGIKNPREHLAAIRSWGTISFVMTRSALQKKEIQSIREFCDQMMFDPALLPDLDTSERAQYNQFEDDLFFGYVDKILSPERERFYSDYDFDISPSTDNRPYFSQFIKMKNIGSLSGSFGSRSIPFFELGYLVLVVTLLQTVLVSFTLIILPLFITGWRAPNKFNIFLYFSGIGLGYMFVEMIFIQRFILYFGSPVYSASAVITSMLIFSGLGSYVSDYFIQQKKRLFAVFGLIAGILLLYAMILTPLLQETTSFSLLFKILVLFLLVAPLAFFMGIPFPSGLWQVSRMNTAHIPWAWAINGCISVISTALATLVSVEMGFVWVMIFAAVAYCLPLLVQWKWKN